MSAAPHYKLAAQQLAYEVGEGLKSMNEDVFRNALRRAGGHPRGRLGATVRKILEGALREEGIHVHPSLTDRSADTYRLYHRETLLEVCKQALDRAL